MIARAWLDQWRMTRAIDKAVDDLIDDGWLPRVPKGAPPVPIDIEEMTAMVTPRAIAILRYRYGDERAEAMLVRNETRHMLSDVESYLATR